MDRWNGSGLLLDSNQVILIEISRFFYHSKYHAFIATFRTLQYGTVCTQLNKKKKKKNIMSEIICLSCFCFFFFFFFFFSQIFNININLRPNIRLTYAVFEVN